MGPVLEPPFDLRFTPLSKAYTFSLRCAAFRAARALGLPKNFLAEGTYAWVSGPTYESPAEGRFLRSVGVDVVGMSTVPEVVAAHQAGMDVLVLSLGTNPVIIPDGYRSAREAVEAEVSRRTTVHHRRTLTHFRHPARWQATTTSGRGRGFT